MNRVAHTILAIGLAFYILDPEIQSFIHILLASALGGMAPDIDRRYRHRKLLHNIFVWIAISIVIFIALNMLTGVGYIYGDAIYIVLNAFILGVLSHLAADSLTVRGVAILYPLSSRHVSLLKLRSDSQLLNTAGVIIGVALFTSWIYRAL